MEIILIRHTSVDVASGVCYGQSDVPLRQTFEQEATLTASNLIQYGEPEFVFTSPLSRCTRLADFCGYQNAIRDNRILELNFGEWEMQAYDQIEDPHLQEWFDDYLNVKATGGESFWMQYDRVVHFIEELKAAGHKRVVAFTHCGVMICAQIYAGVVKAEEAFNDVPPYGGIIKIDI